MGKPLQSIVISCDAGRNLRHGPLDFLRGVRNARAGSAAFHRWLAGEEIRFIGIEGEHELFTDGERHVRIRIALPSAV
jgi:hypothetical protein